MSDNRNREDNPVITLHLRYTQGGGWYIIEHDPSRVFASTNTNERCVGGPFTSVEQAIDERAKLAEAFDRDSAVAS